VDAEGWLHTGDVVTMREDGTIRFLGRYKDLLKVGGENVDPIEVEGFLLRHPAIDQVQVIGVPDPRLSEVPCACIVPKPGEEVTQEALVAFCRGQLASFKIPQYTVVVDGFPMTSSGKVQKFKLREMAAESLGLGQQDTKSPHLDGDRDEPRAQGAHGMDVSDARLFQNPGSALSKAEVSGQELRWPGNSLAA
jgi:fatty-acyl-CoA synthase